MKLLVVRHATAEDRNQFATAQKDDDLRPLTEDGRKRMAKSSRGLKASLETLNVLATSPLVRAVETAEIVAETFGVPEILQVPALRPGTPSEELARWLSTQPQEDTVGIVGHQPDLSLLVAWLTAGSDEDFVDLKKGGACLLDCPETPDQGNCSLLWVLTPAQLKKLG